MSPLLETLFAARDLTESEAVELLDLVSDEKTPAALSGALLAALRAKGESALELRGLARALRARAIDPGLDRDRLVDVVGTGGDGSCSYNLSTGSALLAAAAGARVAKHGNNAVSSRSGSADLLAALGLPIPLGPLAARTLLERCGFTYLHAPHYHPALKAVSPVRRALGTRTVFNILGPLCHPAQPPFAVIGAASESLARRLAEALSGLPLERAYVIHGAAGWDEPTPIGPFLRLEVRPGTVVEERIDPLDLGLPRCAPSQLRGGSALENARALTAVFHGRAGAHRDALLLGAALALELSGVAPDLTAALEQAARALDQGAAAALLSQLEIERVRHA